jgi:hypothetical protein
MTAAIYTQVGPFPSSNNAARWYSPCRGKLLIGCQYAFNAGTKSIDFTMFGETVRVTAPTGNSPITICSNGTDYLRYVAYTTNNPFAGAACIGAEIDIWRAYEEGQWSSSVASTFQLGHSNGGFQCRGEVSIRTASSDVVGIIGVDYGVGGGAVASCVVSPPKTATLTVYDDGTFTLA